MQIGMIGLGRMGSSMVKLRFQFGGHEEKASSDTGIKS